MSKKKSDPHHGLPDKIFVYQYHGNGDDAWWTVEEDLRDCAEKDETRFVGVYQLAEVKRVTLEVTEKVIEK